MDEYQVYVLTKMFNWLAYILGIRPFMKVVFIYG